MKKLSKHVNFFIAAILLNVNSFSQCVFVDPAPPPPPSGNEALSVKESKNGYSQPASGTFRILFVFVEIDYSGSTATDPTATLATPDWLPHQLPSWANNFLDPNVPIGFATGELTRYYQLASSGNYNLIGDYLLSPTNQGVFQIPYAGGVDESIVVNAINTAMGNNFVTAHGLNNPTYFDNWTQTAIGRAKITPSTDSPHKYDHLMFIYRNRQDFNGTGYASAGGGGFNLFGFDCDTYSSYGSYNNIVTGIARHEFGHLIYGGNNFHCGGGGWGPENYWIPLEHGWSNMGLSNSSLLTWNGWDRQRLDWIAPGNAHVVSARDASGANEVNGDLNAINPNQQGTYTLRDFVTYGDAIRIKLPFTNPTTEFPEFIWIENHNSITMNGCIFDQWGLHDYPCLNPAIYGLYMYMQVDKEIRQSTSYSELFYDNYADYLRPITAEGFYDKEFSPSTMANICTGGNDHPYTRIAPNPLTGGGDQDFYTVDVDNDNIINHWDFRDNSIENRFGNFVGGLIGSGDTRQVFTFNGNKKVGVGTNPSSASMMTLVSHDVLTPTVKNLRKIYLNGISIEIIEQAVNGEIKVQIRFDDVHVNNSTRWCGDEIVLNPVSTASGYSLNIKNGASIILDQGTTATRMINPILINGTNVFASPTLMRCTANSYLNIESGGSFIIDNKSTLRLEPNSRLDIANGGILRVKHGGHLELQNGSVINVANGGRIIIEEDLSSTNGNLDYFQGAQINLNDFNSVLEIQGRLNIKDNANFTFSHTSGIRHGYVLFNSSASLSHNVVAGINSSMTLIGHTSQWKVLEIKQETLYGPNSLVTFKIQSGAVVLWPNSRVQPPNGTSSFVTLNLAKFTSNTGANNAHRGVQLYGQPHVSITYCTFEYGKYGINAYNTMGGTSLTVNSSTFRKCTTGIRTQDKAAFFNNCNFYSNTIGWDGVNMSMACRTNLGTVGGSPTSANFKGYQYYAGITAPLWIENPYINYNTFGVYVPGRSFVSTHCGSVSFNKTGFYIGADGLLQMDENISSSGAQVTALWNGRTIETYRARYIYLNKGLNDLTPGISNNQSCVYGSFQTLGGMTINAHSNQWNGSGTFSSSDYYTWSTSAGNPPILFNDQSPFASIPSCGQAIPPCQNPPCPPDPNQGALKYCPLCDEINTDDFAREKLNLAAQEAINKTNEFNDPDNFIKAVDLFYQILMADINNPDSKEKYILNLSYYKMGEALGNAFYYEQITAADNIQTLHFSVQQMIDIQNKFLSAAINNGDNDNRFLFSLDKGLTYRLADRRDLALSIFGEMYQWVQDEQLDITNSVYCSTNLEQQVLDGILPKEDLDEAIEQCPGASTEPQYRLFTPTLPNNQEFQVVENDLRISPNPAENELLIQSNIEHAKITLVNYLGQNIYSSNLNFDLVIDISSFPKGVYFLQIEDSNNLNKSYKKIIFQ